MLLSDFLMYLSSGELSAYSLSNDSSTGVIDSGDYRKLIPSINLGLVELYKKFDLKTDELILEENEGIITYSLTTDYAVSNTTSTQPTKYIIDTESSPFIENILVVTEIVNEEGEEVFINQDDAWLLGMPHRYSIHTPSYNTIQIPEPKEGSQLSVLYRASHEMLDIGLTDASTVNIALPHHFIEPLMFYVAGRFLSNSLAPEKINTGQMLMGKFLQYCLDIRNSGTTQEVQTEITVLDQRGFV